MKMLINDAEINGACILIDEDVDNPIYIGCRFRHCEITTKDKKMNAFSHCIFDETCKVNV